MKRFIAITAVVVLGFAALASAQSSTTKPLADVAKAEEARRKSLRKPAKVYTNSSLRTGVGGDEPAGAPPATASPAAAAPSPAPPATSAPRAEEPPPDGGPAKDQTYWSGRMKEARVAVDRSQIFADSLQSRINALTTDYVNRDDPAQRAKLEGDRRAALAELERVKKELDAQRKAIVALEDEARRAGVPSGWLRPGA